METCILLTDDKGRVLIVKPTYRAGWQFPGGIVDHGEDPETCARRELVEETGPDRPVHGILTVTWSPATTRLGGPAINLVFDAALSRPTPRSTCRNTNSKPTGGRTPPRPNNCSCLRAPYGYAPPSGPARPAPCRCCAAVTTDDHPPARNLMPEKTAESGRNYPSHYADVHFPLC
ncbi:NUDIX domain-containing protein [Streptomyces sp. NPDC054958]